MKKSPITKVLSALLAAVMLFLMIPASVVTAFAEIIGAEPPAAADVRSAPSIKRIYSADDLNAIRDDLDGVYILMNDIDLSGTKYADNWTPIGYAGHPFTGSLLGAGYTISGMNITALPKSADDGYAYVGLFGYNKGVIRDVTLEGAISAEITESQKAYIGSLVGYNDGKVLNCRDGVTYHDYALAKNTLYTGVYTLAAGQPVDISVGKQYAIYLNGTGMDWGYDITIEDSDLPSLYIFLRDVKLTSLNLHTEAHKDIYIISQGTSNVIYAKNDCRALDLPNANVTVLGDAPLTIYGEHGEDGANASAAGTSGSAGKNAVEAVKLGSLVTAMSNGATMTIIGGNGGKGGNGARGTHYSYNSPVSSDKNGAKGPDGGQGGQGGKGGKGATAIVAESITAISTLHAISGNGGQGGQGGQGGDGARGNKGTTGATGVLGIGATDGGQGGQGGDGGFAGNGGDGGDVSIPINTPSNQISGFVNSTLGTVGTGGLENKGGYRGDGGEGGDQGGWFTSAGGSGSEGTNNRTNVWSNPGALGTSPVTWKTKNIDTANGVQTTTDASGTPTTVTISVVEPNATIKVYGYATPSAKTTWNHEDSLLIPAWDISADSEHITEDETTGAVYYGHDDNPYALLVTTNSKSLASYTIHSDTEYIYSYAFGATDTRAYTALKTITLPANTYGVGQHAFDGCTALTRFISTQPIDDIGEKAFYECTSLAEVVLVDHPSKMTIGAGAFQNCISLASIRLPKGIKHMAANIFNGAKKLKAIEIPATVKSIDASAFYACSQLKSVTFAEGSRLDEIGSDAFSGCSALQSVTFPATLQTIGANAFWGNTAMTALHIPASVTSIVGNPFYGCAALASITVDTGNEKFEAKANTLIEKTTNTAILGCVNSNLRDAGVTSVATGAFANLHFTKPFEVPETVKLESGAIETVKLESGAIDSCKGEIILLHKSIAALGSETALKNCDAAKVYAYVDDKSTPEIEDDVFVGDKDAKIIANGQAGEHVYYIIFANGADAGEGLGVAELFLYGRGSTYNYQERAAFVTEINDNLSGYNLYYILVSNGVEEIGAATFQGFSGVVGIQLGKDIKKIGALAFDVVVNGGASLRNISFAGDLPEMACDAIKGYSRLVHNNLFLSNDINTHGWTHNGMPYVCFIPDVGFATSFPADGIYYPLESSRDINYINTAGYDQYGIHYKVVDGKAVIDDYSALPNTPSEIRIPLQIMVAGTRYSVVGIAENAFHEVSTFKTITVRTDPTGTSGISSIAANAFIKCTAQVYLVGDATLAVEGTSPLSVTVADNAFDASSCVIVDQNAKGWETVLKSVTPYTSNILTGNRDQSGIYYTVNMDAATAIVGKKSAESEENLINTSGAGEKDVKIPDFVTYNERLYRVVGFDRYAFFGNQTMETITFGSFIGEGQSETVPAIWDCTFRNVSRLTAITVESNPLYKSAHGVLYGAPLVAEGEDAIFTRLIKYPDNKKDASTFPIPEGVTVIENYAFAGNTALTGVNLNKVNVIGSHAFWNCTALSSLGEGYQIHDVGDSAFENTEITAFAFGESLSTVGVRAFYNSKLTGDVVINDNITLIGAGAFGGCTEITSFAFRDYSNHDEKATLAQTVSGSYRVDCAITDGEGTLRYASLFDCRDKVTLLQFAASFATPENGDGIALYDMNAGAVVPYAIASEAFRGAKYVEEIVMHNSTVEVGSEAFAECRRLTRVTLGKSYFGSDEEDRIGGIYSYDLFINSPALEYIEVHAENAHFMNDSNGVLYSKSKDVLYCYPAGIQRVNYTVPASVTKLYDSAFFANTSLKQVVVGTTKPLSIGSRAFGNCTNLAAVYYVTETVPTVGEKIYDNTPETLCTRFKEEFADKGWSAYASAEGTPTKTWCERIADEYTVISEVPNDSVATNDYLIFVKNTGAEPLADVYVIVTTYVKEQNGALTPHKFYLRTDSTGRINFSTMVGETQIASHIHVYAQKEGFFTYDQDLYLDTDMLISYLTMTMEPDVFGVSCEETDINSQTADLNLALYHEHLTYTVQDGDKTTELEKITYRDVTIKVLGFWDPSCKNPEFTLLQSGKVLPAKVILEGERGDNCTFVISAEAFFDENGKVNEDPIEVRVAVQNGSKGTLECRKTLNITVMDFELNDEDISLDIEEEVSLEEGPDIFKTLFGSAGFQFKLGENVTFKTMIKGSQVILSLSAETPDPEKDYEKGYNEHKQPYNKGSYLFQYFDGLLTYNIRFVKSDADHYYYYRLYVYGAGYSDALMEEKAVYGAVNLSPAEARLSGRSKVALRALSIYMETKEWIKQTLFPDDGCFDLDRFGSEGLADFDPPSDGYVPMNEEGTAQVKNKQKFKAGIEGELVFEYAKGEGLHLASGSVKGYLKYTFKHNSQFVVWVIPVILEVEITVGGEILLKLRFDDPEKPVSLEELSVKLSAEIQASLGIGCAVASIGLYGSIGTVIIFDILPVEVAGVREWEIHGEFGAYVKLFWYKQQFPFWSGKHYIIGAPEEDAAAASLYAARAQMFLASSYRYSPDCEENAQIVKIGDDYYKFYFKAVDEAGYDAYNCIKLVYEVWDDGDWSDYVIVDDNAEKTADAAYTILQDGDKVYLAYTQQTKRLSAESVNDTTAGAEGLSLKWIDLTAPQKVIDTVVDGTLNGDYKYAMQLGIVDGTPVVIWAQNSDNNIFGVSPDNYYDKTTETSHVYETRANSLHIARLQANGEWTDAQLLLDHLSSIVDIAVNGTGIYYVIDLDGDLTDSSDCTLMALAHGSDTPVKLALASAVECYNGQILYYGTDPITEGLHALSGDSDLPTATTMLSNGYVALTDENGIYALLYVETKSWKEGENTLSCSVIKGMFRDESGEWGDPITVYDPEAADCYIASFDAEMIEGQLKLVMQLCDASGTTLACECVDFDPEALRFDYTYEIDYTAKQLLFHVTNTGARSADFSHGIGALNSGKSASFALDITAQSVACDITAQRAERTLTKSASVNTSFVDLQPLVKQMVVGEQNSILIAIRNNGNQNAENAKLYVFGGAISEGSSGTDATTAETLKKQLRPIQEISLDKAVVANGITYYELILDSSMLAGEDGVISLYAVDGEQAVTDAQGNERILPGENEPSACLADNTTAIYLSEVVQTVDGSIKPAAPITPESSISANEFKKSDDGVYASDVLVTVIADPAKTVTVTLEKNTQVFLTQSVAGGTDVLRRIALPASELNALEAGDYTVHVTLDGKELQSFTLKISVAENLTTYLPVDWYDDDGVFLKGITVRKDALPFDPAADAPEAPEKEGYTFLRWEESILRDAEENITRITYVAVYEKLQAVQKQAYTVTWVIADGVQILRTVEQGDLPVPPQRLYKGRVIRGWDKDGDGKADDETVPADGNVTYAALFDNTHDFELRGSAGLGMTLTVDLSLLDFSADSARVAKLKYQWYLDGVAIEDATSGSYAPTPAQQGKKLWVVVFDAEWIGTSAVFEVSSHPHAVFHSPYKAPTCEQDGTITYWYCYTCDVFYYDADCMLPIENVQDTVIPAVSHQYKDTVTPPTCTTDGYTTHVCKNCAHTYVDAAVAALGHDFPETYTTDRAATCTSAGLESFHCSRCDATTGAREIAKLAHAMSAWTQTVAPNCVADGTERRDCADCDHFELQTITKLGHDFATTYTTDRAATCTSAGLESFHCSRCDATTGAREIAKLAHAMSAWTQTAAPNCVADGTERRDCADCDHFELQTITKLGHDFATTYTTDRAATCTSAGLESFHCSRCDATTGEREIAKLAHAMSAWTQTVAPNCVADGTERRDCANCDHFELQTLAKLGHDFATTYTTDRAATCTSAGLESFHCSRCDATTGAREIAKLAHAMSAWTQTVAPNCVADGTERRDCADCDYFELQTITKLGHDFATTYTTDRAATCTSAGLESFHCSRCDATTGAREIAKLDHRYDAGQITLEATAATNGIKTFTCEDCGHSYTQKTAKLAPQITEQSEEVWSEWTGEGTITFRSNAAVADFVELRINGESVPRDQYTLREGSIVVELNPTYLASLENGSYHVEIVSLDGIAATDFSVDKKVMQNPFVLGGVIGGSVLVLAALAVVLLILKKKRKSR